METDSAEAPDDPVQRLQDHLLSKLQDPRPLQDTFIEGLDGVAPNLVRKDEDGQKVFRVASQLDQLWLCAARSALLELAEQATAASFKVMEYRVTGDTPAAMPRLLNFYLWTSHAKLQPLLVSFQIIEDLVEASSVETLAQLFEFLEKVTPELQQHENNYFGNFKKQQDPIKLTILRIANQLLSRISRCVHADLAARIMLFASRLLLPAEPSGLNKMSTLNQSHPIALEAVAEGAMDSLEQPVNIPFYTTFWSLQQAFQNPYSAIPLDKWAETCAGNVAKAESCLQTLEKIRLVLAEFRAKPLSRSTSQANAQQSTPKPAARPQQQQSPDDAERLTVQYLSSSKLMGLQLANADVRQQFLLQCLILLQACAQPKKVNKGNELKPRQLTELEEVKALVLEALEKVTDKGAAYAHLARHVMQREAGWEKWKAGGANDFDRPPMQRPVGRQLPPVGSPNGQEEPPRKRPRTAVTKATVAIEVPDNMAGLDSKQRLDAGALRPLLDDVIMGMDPSEGIEPEFKHNKEPVLSWKVLRHVARQHVRLHTLVAEKKDLEEVVWSLFPQDVPEGAVRPELTGRQAASQRASTPLLGDAEPPGTPLEEDPAPASTPLSPSSREHATDAAEAQKGKSAAADSLPDLPAQPKAAATVGPQSAPADNAGKAGIAVSSALAQQSNVKPP